MWKDWDIGFERRLFENIDKEFSEAEEMLNRVFRTVRNVRPSARGLVEQSGIREPLVDTKIDEKDNALTITAEMPGVTKQDVKVNIAEDHVSIHAEKGE